MGSSATECSKIRQVILIAAFIESTEQLKSLDLTTESIEFWQGNKDRFHKRLRYDLINGVWQYQLLQP